MKVNVVENRGPWDRPGRCNREGIVPSEPKPTDSQLPLAPDTQPHILLQASKPGTRVQLSQLLSAVYKITAQCSIHKRLFGIP